MNISSNPKITKAKSVVVVSQTSEISPPTLTQFKSQAFKQNQEENESTVSHKKSGSFSDLKQIIPKNLFLIQDHFQIRVVPKKSPIFNHRPNTYRYTHQIFQQSTITYQMRTVLLNWLILVASEHYFNRQTFARGSYYVDRYLQNKKNFSKQNLQLLGFSVMRLAAKLQQSKLTNNVDVFTKPEIIKYQKQICLLLNFRLNPDTYIYWINLIMSSWDNYCVQEKKYENIKYLDMTKQSFRRSRQIYEICDIINLDIKSMSFKLQELLLNMFFIITRKNIQEIQKFQQNLQQYKNQFNVEDSFNRYFLKFIQFMGLSECLLKVEIGEYIFPFLRLPINYHRHSIQVPSYFQYINIQTFNDRMLPLLRKIYQKRKQQ